MTSLNITEVCTLPKEQFITEVGQSVALPSLLTLFAGLSLILLIVGMIFIHGKESKLKMLGIWFLTTIAGAILLLGIYFNPNTIFDYFQKFIGLLS